MTRRNTELDRLRAGRSELENHYIDELVAGRLDRRTFLRRGSAIGLSATFLGTVLAACGSGSTSSSSSSGTGTSGGTAVKGGTLRIAASTPAAAVNPLTVADAGGLLMLNQTGEFLIFDSNLKLALQPMLALSWKPNKDGSVWTFKLRTGVKFHNGKEMTADDVVYTFKQLSDPKNASNALSTFTSVLTPSGVKKVNASTVEFHLEAPERELPLPGVVGQLQRDHRARPGPTSASGRRRSSARARSSSAATPRTSAPRSSPTRTTGAPRRCWRTPRSSSTPASSRRSSRCRATTSTSSPSSSRPARPRC